MFVRLTASVFSALVVSGAALAAKEEGVQEILARYEKTGESVDCISLRSIRHTEVLDDYTMIFEVTGATYLNELNGRCSGLSRDGRYLHNSPMNSMCKGEIISVLDSFSRVRGSCGLGEFEKIIKIPPTE